MRSSNPKSPSALSSADSEPSPLPSNQLANQTLNPTMDLNGIYDMTAIRKHHHRVFQPGMTDGLLQAMRFFGHPHWYECWIHNEPHNPIGPELAYIDNLNCRPTIAFNTTLTQHPLSELPLIQNLPGVIGVQRGFPLKLDVTTKVLFSDRIYFTLAYACSDTWPLPTHNCDNQWHNHYLGTPLDSDMPAPPLREQPMFYIHEAEDIGELTHLMTDHFQHITMLHPRTNLRQITITFTCSSKMQPTPNTHFIFHAYGTACGKPFNEATHIHILDPEDPLRLPPGPSIGLPEHKIAIQTLYKYLREDVEVPVEVQNYQLTPALKVAIAASYDAGTAVANVRPTHRLGLLKQYFNALTNRAPIIFSPSPHVYTYEDSIAIQTGQDIHFKLPMAEGAVALGDTIHISFERTVLDKEGKASIHHRLDGPAGNFRVFAPYYVVPDADQYDLNVYYKNTYTVMCLKLKPGFRYFTLRFCPVRPEDAHLNYHLRLAANLPLARHAHSVFKVRPVNCDPSLLPASPASPPLSPAPFSTGATPKHIRTALTRPPRPSLTRPSSVESIQSIHDADELLASQQDPPMDIPEPPLVTMPGIRPLTPAPATSRRPAPPPTVTKLSRSYNWPPATPAILAELAVFAPIVTPPLTPAAPPLAATVAPSSLSPSHQGPSQASQDLLAESQDLFADSLEPVITQIARVDLTMIPEAHSDNPANLYLEPDSLRLMLSESDDDEQMAKIPKQFEIKDENYLRLFLKRYHAEAQKDPNFAIAIYASNTIFDLCDRDIIYHPDMHIASHLPAFYTQPSRHSVLQALLSDSMDYDCRRLLVARNRDLHFHLARQPVEGDLFYLTVNRSAEKQQENQVIFTCNAELHETSRADMSIMPPSYRIRPPLFPAPSPYYNVMERELHNGQYLYGISPKPGMTTLTLRATCTGERVYGYKAKWIGHIFGRAGGRPINEHHLFTALEPEQLRPINSRPPPQLDFDEENVGKLDGPTTPRRIREGRPAPQPPIGTPPAPTGIPEPASARSRRLYLDARARESLSRSPSTLNLLTSAINKTLTPPKAESTDAEATAASTQGFI